MNFLQLFGVDYALIGDLIEQRRAGRSRPWLFYQLVMAIVTRVASGLRRDTMSLPIAAGVAFVSLGVPAVWLRFLWHYALLVDRAWYPATSNWLARSAPHTIWRAVMFLQPWMWTYDVAFCLVLAAVAWCLVRALPTHRFLVLTVFVLAGIAQCVTPVERISLDWWHAPTNPVWVSNLIVYGAFVFVATPLSITVGGFRRMS